MKDPPRLFSSMRHDDDSGVTEASGTDLRFSVSLTNPFCFQGTNSGFFWRLLQQHPAPCSRRGPRVAAEGQARATGVRWALPRAKGLVRCSWQRCQMERKPPIKPTDLVLLNGFLVRFPGENPPRRAPRPLQRRDSTGATNKNAKGLFIS